MTWNKLSGDLFVEGKLMIRDLYITIDNPTTWDVSDEIFIMGCIIRVNAPLLIKGIAASMRIDRNVFRFPSGVFTPLLDLTGEVEAAGVRVQARGLEPGEQYTIGDGNHFTEET